MQFKKYLYTIRMYSIWPISRGDPPLPRSYFQGLWGPQMICYPGPYYTALTGPVQTTLHACIPVVQTKISYTIATNHPNKVLSNVCMCPTLYLRDATHSMHALS